MHANKHFKKMKTILLGMTGIFFLSSGGSICYAENLESLDHLTTLAKDFIVKHTTVAPDEVVDVQIAQSNLKIRVAQCPTEIEAKVPKESSLEQINAVELVCNGPQPWHTFVPVNVQVMTNVVVAKHVIAQKDMLTEDDVDLAPRDKNHLYSGFFKEKKQVLGLESAQLITPGTVLTKKNVKLPVLVNREQAIDIVVRKHSMLIVMKGIAKSDGRLNESIKVFNPSSKRMLDAVVISSNKAEVVS